MKRFNIMRGFLIAAAIATAIATGGCAAESSTPDGTGQSVDEVDTARAVFVHEAQGPVRATSGAPEQGMSHPTGAGLGPSPDPWIGGDDNSGPSPDPWVPRARRGSPPGDPDPGTNTSGGAGGSSSSSNNK